MLLRRRELFCVRVLSGCGYGRDEVRAGLVVWCRLGGEQVVACCSVWGGAERVTSDSEAAVVSVFLKSLVDRWEGENVLRLQSLRMRSCF